MSVDRLRVPGITSVFALVLLLVAAIAVFSWLRVQHLQQDIQTLTEEHIQKVDHVHRMRSLVRERVLRASLVVSAEDTALQERYHREFRDLAPQFVETLAAAEAQAEGAADRQRMQELRELTSIGAPLLEDIVDLALVGDRNEALGMLYADLMPIQEEVLGQMERILENFHRDNAQAIEAMAQRHEQSQEWMLWATVLAAVLIVLLGGRVRYRLRRNHQALQEELRERARVEARLRETQGGLEAAVARRTAELEETTARLEEAQRSAGAGFWDWDIRNGQLNWSAHVFELFGLDPRLNEAGFESYIHAVHPDDRARARRTINQALASEAVYRVDHRVVRPDGGVRHVRVEGEIARDDTGRPLQVLGMVRDVTLEKASEERLWHQAHHDSLTGLANRSLFQEHLRQAMRRAQRNETGLALVVCDLDGFKPINDRLGHDAGDVVLVTVAGRLREGVRESDVVARMGGDEFVILLENMDDPDALLGVGLKLIERFAEPIEVNREAVQVGLSMGAALYPHDSADPEGLMLQADRAMYAAKEAGGGGIVLHEQVDVSRVSQAGTRHRRRGPLGCGLGLETR
ncbi:diguanylate cyclase domain-containing protein [Thioalkalivibrio sp. ARh3]|uniref:diguanylate cyclase domain-containing protein n=1 Tax=Thioalkalivibrio sp. ARh3 TaxID=1158148 RepID=UPI00037F6A0B|nr:diguanylate cyclase [Thioalkalivibrio sp. ARh3]